MSLPQSSIAALLALQFSPHPSFAGEQLSPRSLALFPPGGFFVPRMCSGPALALKLGTRESPGCSHAPLYARPSNSIA